MPKWVCSWLLLVLCFLSCERIDTDHESLSAAYLGVDDFLVDSLMREMSLQEKIGQLLIWKPGADHEQLDSLPAFLQSNKIAGYQLNNFSSDIFLQIQDTCLSNPIRTPFVLTDQPLFVQNNFSDYSPFPAPIALMANGDFEGFGSFWKYSSKRSHQIGFNSVRCSPLKHFEKVNSSIHDQIIASNDAEVLRNGIAEMNSWQAEEFLAFGGPLDKSIYNPSDSLIQGSYTWSSLFSMIQNGLDGIYIDPELYLNDSLKVIPPNFLANFISTSFQFNGLLLSEVEGEIEFARAYLAGVDIVISSITPKRAAVVMRELFSQSVFAQNMLDDKVRKILKAKIWMEKEQTFDRELASEKLAMLVPEELEQLGKQVRRNATTLLHNQDQFIPLNQGNRRFRILDIGAERSVSFLNNFEFYADAGSRFFPWKNNALEKAFNPGLFKGRPLVLVLNNVDLTQARDTNLIPNLREVLTDNKSVLINIGYPENLSFLDTLAKSIVQAFDNSPWSQQHLSEIIFGGSGVQGKLPLTIDSTFVAGSSVVLEQSRIRRGRPDEVDIDGGKLNRIGTLARKGIAAGAFPGCQVAIIKDGVLLYEESFGHLDSAATEKVKWDHLYDVASISKVAGTALAGMRLYERGKLKLRNKISNYLDLPSNSRVKRVSIKDLFTHRSGLQPHMPIVPIVFPKTERPDANRYTNTVKGGLYQIKVADELFFNITYRDSVWNEVWKLRARRRKFRYSDANFMILQKIIEKQARLSLDQYVSRHFYKSLNLRRTAYRPLEQFKAAEIAPSAHDRKWRKQLLRGYVHDEAAALEGGVGGNAGLFSNARDLGVIGQMLLNKGNYGGKRYLEEKTVELFTRSGHGNHRGLAFDKKSRSKKGSISHRVSSSSFGHTGFTGSLFWVDPKHDLVFVFNTNRIHPKVNNRIIYKGKYRKKIHEVVYRAMAKKKETEAKPLRVKLED